MLKFSCYTACKHGLRGGPWLLSYWYPVVGTPTMGEKLRERAGVILSQAVARNAAFTPPLVKMSAKSILKREKYSVLTYIHIGDETYKSLDIYMDILRIQSMHEKMNWFVMLCCIIYHYYFK